MQRDGWTTSFDRTGRSRAAWLVVVLVAGCGAHDDTFDASALADLAVATDAAQAIVVDASADCVGVAATCTSWNTRSFCVGTPSGPTTQTETCPSGCYEGACSTSACSDECALGTKSSSGQTCELWSMGTQAFVTPDVAGSLHERARDYDATRRAIATPEGAIMNPNFTDATFQTVSLYTGTGDSSIWTGTALAAQAWRLLVTGEPDAAAQLATLASTIHLFFSVTGDPAYLARLTVPSNTTTPLEDSPRCADDQWHCAVSYGGTSYDWLGHTSRDQYTGAMLGYAIAYMASAGNEPLRATIRQDVVAVATQLMKTQTFQASVTVTTSGVPLSFTKTLTLENIILAPSEMTNGKVVITIDTSDAGDAEMTGVRDFLPDYGTFVSQLLGTSPAIPRPSTTMMLGGFFDMALMMTDGVPGMEATHQSLLAYYQAHVAKWISIASGWTFQANCGSGYFANHIAFIMAYVWGLLEEDAGNAALIRGNVIDKALWGALSGQKNSYFAFMWGGTRSAPDPVQITSATTQLAGFPPGPRIDTPTSLESNPAYLPHDATCGAGFCDTATLAVDVKDRRVSDFIWQRDPWELTDPGNPLLVYPGVDYLAAYWAGRYHGFISEDAAGTCARFAP